MNRSYYMHLRGTVIAVETSDGKLCTHNMTMTRWREARALNPGGLNEVPAWQRVKRDDLPKGLNGRRKAAEARCDAYERALSGEAQVAPPGDPSRAPDLLKRCKCGRASFDQSNGGPCTDCTSMNLDASY